MAVIQQRFDPETKSTFWTEVDAWLTDALYLHPKFKEFFDERRGLYGRPLPHGNHPADYVGDEDETHSKTAVGDCI